MRSGHALPYAIGKFLRRARAGRVDRDAWVAPGWNLAIGYLPGNVKSTAIGACRSRQSSCRGPRPERWSRQLSKQADLGNLRQMD